MGISQVEYDNFIKNKNMGTTVASWCLLNGFYDAFLMGYLIPKYKDNPTKKKAIAIFKLFFDEKGVVNTNKNGVSKVSTYLVNLDFGNSTQPNLKYQHLVTNIMLSDSQRKCAQKIQQDSPILGFFNRALTAGARKAEPDMFDGFFNLTNVVETYQLKKDGSSINEAKDIVQQLLEAGFKDIVKLQLL